ncbi:MAG: hypothetical protein R6V67_07620 [Spirochaetia bacterium]
MKRKLLATVFLLTGILICGGNSGADTAEVTSEEKERFESAYSEVVSLREGLEEEETEIIEEASVSEDLINYIYEAYITNNQGLFSMANDEEKEEFSRVIDNILDARKMYREQEAEAIDEYGFTKRRFYQLVDEYKYEDEEENEDELKLKLELRGEEEVEAELEVEEGDGIIE